MTPAEAQAIMRLPIPFSERLQRIRDAQIVETPAFVAKFAPPVASPMLTAPPAGYSANEIIGEPGTTGSNGIPLFQLTAQPGNPDNTLLGMNLGAHPNDTDGTIEKRVSGQNGSRPGSQRRKQKEKAFNLRFDYSEEAEGQPAKKTTRKKSSRRKKPAGRASGKAAKKTPRKKARR